MKICGVAGCGKKVLAKGWCSAHYRRLRRYGTPLDLKQTQLHGLTLRQRLSAYTKKTSTCWEWIGYRDPNGYGRLNVGLKPILAHRIAWEVYHDVQLTPDQHVCHRCDNPCCVRPGHLFLGDPQMNTADKMAKKRHRYGTSHGEDHGMAKLTNEQVLEIRASTEKNVSALSRKYGVARAVIRDIRNRKIWRHI